MPPRQYELAGHREAPVRVASVSPVVNTPGSATVGTSEPSGQYTLAFPQLNGVAATDPTGQ